MLTDTQIKAAKPRAKMYKLYDHWGLYLAVAPSGVRSWRYDYRIDGKRETLTLGVYPVLELADARARHLAARRQVSDGQSPAAAKRDKRLAAMAIKAKTASAKATAFKTVAEKWYADQAGHRSTSWNSNIVRWLNADIYPTIGDKDLADVTPHDVLAIMNKVKDRGAARSAGCIRRLVSQIYQYAINNLLVDYYDPTQSVRKALVLPPHRNHPHLAVRDIPAFMAAVDADHASAQTKLAAKLLLHTFVRKAELVEATWGEINFDLAEWHIPAERIKTRKIHIVPLSVQVVGLFQELRAMGHGSRFVFPALGGRAEKSMSGSVLNKMFDRIGYAGRLTPHGLRSTASTALHEMGFQSEVIETSLAHADRNAIRKIYSHAEYLPARHKLMAAWSDFLVAQAGGNVIPLRSIA